MADTKETKKKDGKKKSDDSKSTSSETASKSSSGGGGSGGGARPISYFSSVSTDDYRSGWDDIFSKKKAAKPARRKPTKAPLTIELEIDQLGDELQSLLTDAARRQAKKKRRNFDKLAADGQVHWQLSCRIEP